jgi:predicted metalloendopeptidase
MHRFILPLLIVTIFGLSACDTSTPAPETRPMGLGFDPANMDTTVRPQDDFYRYVNGSWLEKTEIPADKSNFGAFIALADQAELAMRNLIEDAAEAEFKPVGSDEQKVGDFYLSFMDSTRIESLGLASIEAELELVAAIQSPEDLIRYIGYNQRLGVTDPFSAFVSQDAKNTTEYILYMSQSGLGLPNRDYYFDDRFEEVRSKYVDHIATMHDLAEFSAGQQAANTIMALETRLAEQHWTPVQNRDRDATYNKYSIDEANRLTPNFDWNVFLEAAETGPVDAFIIRQPSYFEALNQILADVPIADWKTYFRFKLLSNAAPYLPKAFADADFDFFSRTISGIEENQPRWKRGVTATNGVLGETVGKLYVEKHFQEEAKARMDELIANLREAFRQSINELEWMTDSTKAEAQTKLTRFNAKIAYPDEWKDYSALEIHAEALLDNLRRSADVEYRRMLDKLGSPIDRGEWFMTPQTVNAYYSPSMNEIVFPAAILQPPFFNVEADDAVNYGAIGAVIGHEFSHGFDDQGRKSDGDGNLRDWWTEADAAEFKKRADVLVEQYNTFSPIEGMNVNGELTLGENIGDLAGLTMAYKAYKLSLNGEEAPVIKGYTGDQRFFIGWAQVWQRKYREAELMRRLRIDPHSPSEYRTNGIVANMPAFYEAFNLQAGDSLYRAPDERVMIW